MLARSMRQRKRRFDPPFPHGSTHTGEKIVLMEERYDANGVDIYAIRNGNLHSFCLCLYILAGSMYEKDGENGISHLYEHAVFSNLVKLTDGRIYRELSLHGISVNASTYREFIRFTVSGLPDGFDFALYTLSLILSPFSLSLSDLEGERRRIKAEIREDDEKNGIEYLLTKAAWDGTPLANTVSGKWSTVSRISLKKLEEYRRNNVNKQNSFVCVTGNVSGADIKKLIDTVSKADFGEATEKRDNAAPVPSDFLNRNTKIAIKQSSYTYVGISFDIDMTKHGGKTVDIIHSLLFDGDDAVLFEALSGDDPVIYGFYDTIKELYKNAGRIFFTFETERKRLYECLNRITEALVKVKRGEYDAMPAVMKEYASAKTASDDTEMLNWDTAYKGHILSYLTTPEEYQKIKKDDVTTAAADIFKTQNLTVAVKGDKRKISEDKIKEIFKVLDL